MKPKEKGKELIEKFYPIVEIHTNSMVKNAKACAIICVDEIMKIVNPMREALQVESDEYWEQVKDYLTKQNDNDN